MRDGVPVGAHSKCERNFSSHAPKPPNPQPKTLPQQLKRGMSTPGLHAGRKNLAVGCERGPRALARFARLGPITREKQLPSWEPALW